MIRLNTMKLSTESNEAQGQAMLIKIYLQFFGEIHNDVQNAIHWADLSRFD